MKKASDFGDLMVGLFVAGVLVLLAFFTIVISGSNFLRGGGQRLEVGFSDVGGLRPHDSVIVHGVPVGQVKKMWLAREGGVQVCHEQDEDRQAWGGINSTYGAVLALYAQATGSAVLAAEARAAQVSLRSRRRAVASPWPAWLRRRSPRSSWGPWTFR